MARVLIGMLALVITAPAPAVSSATERYYQGLRARGLLDLAEGSLLQNLAEPDLPLDERAELTAELSRTFAHHALFAQGAERDDLWRRSESLVNEFLAGHAEFTLRDVFLVQKGNIRLERGRAERWRAELQPDAPEAGRNAREHLEGAISHLASIEPLLESHLLAKQRRTIIGQPPLPAGRLHELLRRTRQLLGEAELERTRLTSPDLRAVNLQAARDWFDAALEMGGTPDELWPAQAGLAEAARLAGDGQAARRHLADIETAAAGNDARDAAARVMAALMIDEGKPDQAVTFLIDYRQERGRLTGPLRMLQIRALAASAAALDKQGESELAQTLRDEVDTVVKWTMAEHRGYWAFRARLAARNIERQATLGPEAIEQLRQARLDLDRGDKASAAEHFRRAADAITDPARRAELRYSQGRLFLGAARYQAAEQALAQVASDSPEFEHAAMAHFLSARALGLWHDADPSAARRESYLARLSEHRVRFPDSPTAAWAALRIASVHETRRQYTEALDFLRQILDDPKHAAEAAAAIARIHEKILAYLDHAGQTAKTARLTAIRRRQQREWAVSAREELLRLTATIRERSGEPLTAQQAELALRAAGLFLKAKTDAFETAARELIDRLGQAFDQPHPDEARAFWAALERSASPLLVVLLAERGESIKARNQLEAMADAPIGDLLFVYQRLLKVRAADEAALAESPYVSTIGRGTTDAGARFLSVAARRMLEDRRPKLAAEQLRPFTLAMARAEVAGGNASHAAARLDRLLQEYPRDIELVARAAEILGQSAEPAALRAAREHWRRIERARPSGSDAWLRARLRVIETSLDLGDAATAAKLLAVTKLLHPSLGGEPLRPRFDAAERRVKSEGDG